MRRLILITTLALALVSLAATALPAAADAAGYQVDGGGFGHGVGMSQYGAYGQALEGRGYERILSHYYRDTTLGDVGRARVRVLLQASRPAPASFSNAKRAGGKRLDPRQTYTVDASRRAKLVVYAGDRRVGGFRAPLRVRGKGHRLRLGGTAMNGVDDGLYRGRLDFRPGLSGGITAVNDLRIDDYVRGVISAEMPASWHPEALEAQAVVARSYALATSKDGDIFDHYPDTRSQVYRGIAAEYPSTDRAVRRTAGEVVRYRGEVATTYFFSASGGHTEDVENVFGSRVPYLRGVKDPHDDISPNHRWSHRFTRAQMEQRLGSLVKGRFRGVKVLRRGASPRIIRAEVRGSAGSTEVSGATLMYRLGTYDMPTSVRRVRSTSRTAAARVVPGPEDAPSAAPSAVPLPPKD